MGLYWRGPILMLLLTGIFVALPSRSAHAGGVVGTGTVASCTEGALNAALTGGGLVTFNCGPNPVTIGLTSEKVIAIDTQIDGDGLITLDGQDSTRHFYVNNGIALDIQGITLENGNGDGINDRFGGAIWNDGGTVTLANSMLIDNRATSGGGIWNEGGTLYLIASTIQHGIATGIGGGIFNRDGLITISDSELSLNSAVSGGGALYNSGGSVMIADSTMSNNSSSLGRGGGVLNFRATVSISGSTLSNNRARLEGGGVFNGEDAVASITRSVLTENHTEVIGGGIANEHHSATVTISRSILVNNTSSQSGAAVSTSGVLTLRESTLSRNRAESAGGGIYSFGELEIVKSTVSGNVAGTAGGGIFSFGGRPAILNSTVSGNEAGTDGGGIANRGRLMAIIVSSTIMDNQATTGGGIWNDQTVSVRSSIIANSPTGSNCGGDNPITSLGSNLSSDGTCNLTQPGDQTSIDPMLGLLADNDGPTFTHAPFEGSPVIDAATDCASTTDQRGIGRPQGDACDIGAVEVRQSAHPLCVDVMTGVISSSRSGDCGSGEVEVGSLNQTFCINSFTGEVSFTFGRPCNPPRIEHTMPDDGDLLTCVHIFTGAHRWVWNHSQCTAGEIPNTIPATP